MAEPNVYLMLYTSKETGNGWVQSISFSGHLVADVLLGDLTSPPHYVSVLLTFWVHQGIDPLMKAQAP